MSPMNTLTLTDTLSFPRVSGDEPTCPSTKYLTGMFSPRERG